jgi:hypothetical protein
LSILYFSTTNVGQSLKSASRAVYNNNISEDIECAKKLGLENFNSSKNGNVITRADCQFLGCGDFF